MLYLWIFGNNVEDRLGAVAFLALLPRRRRRGGAGPGGRRPDVGRSPTIGASGAIAAVLGAYIVLFPRRPDQSLVFLGLLLPADRRAGGDRARLLVRAPAHRRRSARSAPAERDGGVAFFAHIGGLRRRRRSCARARRVMLAARAGPAGRRRRPWDNPAHGRRRAGRDGRRERARPHAVEPPRRRSSRRRGATATCPIWIGAVGGERDRDEAPGPHRRSAR